MKYSKKIGETLEYASMAKRGKSVEFTKRSGVVRSLRTVKQALVSTGKNKREWVDLEVTNKED